MRRLQRFFLRPFRANLFFAIEPRARGLALGYKYFTATRFWLRSSVPHPRKSVFICGCFLNLCAFASLADEAKGGDGAKSALREIFLFWVLESNRSDGAGGVMERWHRESRICAFQALG